MEIVINREDYSIGLVQNQIRWKMLMRKNYLISYYYLVSGLFVMTLPLLISNESEPYWGIVPSIGLGLVFLFLMYTSHFYRNKKRFFAKTNYYIQHLNKGAENITIKITDALITYKDFETYTETKWSVYTHYKFYQDYLLLISHDEYYGGLTVGKQEMTAEEFSELSAFVSSRLRAKP